MDEIVVTALNKAANLIRSGEMDQARKIIKEILQRNDNIEQAWFLLSYTMPENEKKHFALQKALKINPEFEKAKARLAKIVIDQPPVPITDDMEKPPEAEPAVDTSQWNVASDTKPLPRLSNEIEDKAEDKAIEIEDFCPQ